MENLDLTLNMDFKCLFLFTASLGPSLLVPLICLPSELHLWHPLALPGLNPHYLLTCFLSMATLKISQGQWLSHIHLCTLSS